MNKPVIQAIDAHQELKEQIKKNSESLENEDKKKQDYLEIITNYETKELFLRACEENKLNIVNQLIKQIPNLNFEIMGASPLWLAVSNDNISLCELLIENGVNTNEMNQTGFGVLVGVSSLKMLNLLIENEMNIHIQEENTQSPLYCIACMGYLGVFEKLLNFGVKYQHLDFNHMDDVNENLNGEELKEKIQVIIKNYEKNKYTKNVIKP